MKGKRLVKLRKDNKLTQEQLAEKLNVSASTISSWENNKTEPSKEDIAALKRILTTDKEVIEKNSPIELITLKNVVELLYLALLIILPLFFFVSFTAGVINNVVAEVANNTYNFINIQSLWNYAITELVFIYGYFTIANLSNYAFFKTKSKLAFIIAIAIEIVFIFVNLVSANVYYELALFAFPAITGMYQFMYNYYEEKSATK